MVVVLFQVKDMDLVIVELRFEVRFLQEATQCLRSSYLPEVDRVVLRLCLSLKLSLHALVVMVLATGVLCTARRGERVAVGLVEDEQLRCHAVPVQREREREGDGV